jgi:hypothetical protein
MSERRYRNDAIQWASRLSTRFRGAHEVGRTSILISPFLQFIDSLLSKFLGYFVAVVVDCNGFGNRFEDVIETKPTLILVYRPFDIMAIDVIEQSIGRLRASSVSVEARDNIVD